MCPPLSGTDGGSGDGSLPWPLLFLQLSAPSFWLGEGKICRPGCSHVRGVKFLGPLVLRGVAYGGLVLSGLARSRTALVLGGFSCLAVYLRLYLVTLLFSLLRDVRRDQLLCCRPVGVLGLRWSGGGLVFCSDPGFLIRSGMPSLRHMLSDGPRV